MTTNRATPANRATRAASAPPASAPPAARHAPGRAAWVAGTIGVAATLFTCYLRQSRTISVGSDGASQVLQAWDMLHGNPLLHGWRLTDVSFYSTELPQYAMLELIRGLSPDVMQCMSAAR